MPELPEVETIASDLNRLISGKHIKNVWFDFPKQISIMASESLTYKGKIIDRLNLAASPKNQDEFIRILKGKKIIKVSRRAKNVLIHLSSHKMLLIHPKMTGHLLIGRWKLYNSRQIPANSVEINEKVNSYIHFLISFTDGTMLAFSDARKFGKILLADEDVLLKSRDLRLLGPEPLKKGFNLEAFRKIIKDSILRGNAKAKQFLLNQNKIAGIGNIYSDDILWLSKIHPLRPIKSLKDSEIKLLFESIKKILEKAVKHRGTSMSDYRDPSGKSGSYMKHILVYGKKGEKCSRCGSEITRIVAGARSAHFCAVCQK